MNKAILILQKYLPVNFTRNYGIPLSKKTFRQDVNDIYDRVVKEKENFQFAYDGLTDHNRNRRSTKRMAGKNFSSF